MNWSRRKINRGTWEQCLIKPKVTGIRALNETGNERDNALLHSQLAQAGVEVGEA
jgi:hypothetical protein